MRVTVLRLIKKFLQHELITGSLFIFIGSLISNFFSFLYNLFIARNLTLSDYAIVASLMSIIALATLPSQSISTIIIQFATNFFTSKQEKKAAAFYIKTTKVIVYISIAILVISLLFSSFIASFLKIDNRWYPFLAGLIVSLGYLNVVNGSFLQSLLKFKLIAFLGALGSFLRLLFGLIFIFIGWRVYGALGALIVSYIVAFILYLMPLKFIFSIAQKEVHIQLKELILYAIPTSLAVIALSSFISTDIILVKHFFSPQQAGIYAGVSLVGRVIFYFTSPIPSVMFPLIIKKYNNNESTHGVFYLSLGLVALASIGLSLFYFLFPQLTLSIFFGGKKYLQASSLLGIFGLYISIFSLVNVCTTFFLSLKRTNIAYIIGAGALLQILLISLYHKNFFEIIYISIFISLVLLILLLLYYLKEYGKKANLAHNPSI